VVEIPFAAFFPEDVRDEHMPEKLRAEGAGILRWMVEGALSWQRIGLAKPLVVRQATESYRDSEDVLKHYLQERTVQGKDFWVYDKELYSSYRAWCEINKEFELKNRKFSGAMSAHGYRAGRQKKGKIWRGLRIELGPSCADFDESVEAIQDE
jgi:putative DNA primase/helicase